MGVLGWDLGTRVQPNDIHSGPLKTSRSMRFPRASTKHYDERMMVIVAVQTSFSSMSCLRGESCGVQALI